MKQIITKGFSEFFAYPLSICWSTKSPPSCPNTVFLSFFRWVKRWGGSVFDSNLDSSNNIDFHKKVNWPLEKSKSRTFEKNWRYSRKSLQISVGWLVGNAVFSKTALRIFLIFCMKLGDYKVRKVTEMDL